MKEVVCNPIKESHTNSILRGYEDVKDLPITRFQYNNGVEAVLSVWKVSSFFQRLKFLFDGRINVTVMAVNHPPISITIGKLGMEECL